MNRLVGVTGIILAGGRATRFGGRKLEADLHGRSILGHVIARISPLVDEVILAGPAADRALDSGDDLPIRALPDAEPFGGPLPALAGALQAAAGDLALVVGGDMPLVVPEVLRALLDRAAAEPTVDLARLGAPADVPAFVSAGASADPTDRDGRGRVLPFACRIEAAAGAAREALDSGDRSLRGLQVRLRGAEVPASTWLALDPGARTLVDVDTPAELERLRAALPREGLLG